VIQPRIPVKVKNLKQSSSAMIKEEEKYDMLKRIRRIKSKSVRILQKWR